MERYVHTVKDRTKSVYNPLPFRQIPRVMVAELVWNAVFLLNTFPDLDGMTATVSPMHIVTSKKADADKDVKLEFGTFVQIHEDHTNGIRPRTTGAICHGPSDNVPGGHYFMSLATGRRIHHSRWTALPMPADAVQRADWLKVSQGMPQWMVFTDRYRVEYGNIRDESESDDNTESDSDWNSQVDGLQEEPPWLEDASDDK